MNNSPSYAEIFNATKLTVVYRTAAPSIANAFYYFKDNVAPVESLPATISSHIKDPADVAGILGVTGATTQSIEDILSKPSGQDRLLIVSNKDEVAKYKHLSDGDPKLSVRTFVEAQGSEATEVYISIDRGLKNDHGVPLDDNYTFNKIMYMSIGRSSRLVVIDNKTVKVEPNIDPSIKSEAEDEFDQVQQNVDDYLLSKETADNYAEILDVETKVEPAPVLEETPSADKVEDVDVPVNEEPSVPATVPVIEADPILNDEDDVDEDFTDDEGFMQKDPDSIDVGEEVPLPKDNFGVPNEEGEVVVSYYNTEGSALRAIDSGELQLKENAQTKIVRVYKGTRDNPKVMYAVVAELEQDNK